MSHMHASKLKNINFLANFLLHLTYCRGCVCKKTKQKIKIFYSQKLNNIPIKLSKNESFDRNVCKCRINA